MSLLRFRVKSLAGRPSSDKCFLMTAVIALPAEKGHIHKAQSGLI